MLPIFLSFVFTTSNAIQLNVIDTPNDGGESITLQWKILSQLDGVVGTEIYRSDESGGPFEKIKFVLGRQTQFTDRGVKDGKEYYYRLSVITENDTLYSDTKGPVVSSAQWFHKGRINILAGVLIYMMMLFGFIIQAKQGRKLFLRLIPGIAAVDEAVGRATEMGRPVLYIPGISTISDVATIASLNILAHITKKIAQYETRIIVPNRDPVVFLVAREVVKEAYHSVGRPDLFDPDSVFYVTDSQFGYAAAVSGIMVRERPATNFLQGMFYAESLILAETGAATGAIQIAGTDAVTQLPFFITACDYTLIGEELYAASAYLSKEPVLTATLKGQDWMKALITGILIATTILTLTGFTKIMGIF